MKLQFLFDTIPLAQPYGNDDEIKYSREIILFILNFKYIAMSGNAPLCYHVRRQHLESSYVSSRVLSLMKIDSFITYFCFNPHLNNYQ